MKTVLNKCKLISNIFKKVQINHPRFFTELNFESNASTVSPRGPFTKMEIISSFFNIQSRSRYTAPNIKYQMQLLKVGQNYKKIAFK
jgi:hypothetical protein